MIDATFSVIYIAVMAVYSWALTLIALVVVPIQVVITLVGALYSGANSDKPQKKMHELSHT